MSKYTKEYLDAAREEAKKQYENTIKNINESELRYTRAREKFKGVDARMIILEREYLAAKARYEKYTIIYEDEKKILGEIEENYKNSEVYKAAALEQYESRLRRLDDK